MDEIGMKMKIERNIFHSNILINDELSPYESDNPV